MSERGRSSLVLQCLASLLVLGLLLREVDLQGLLSALQQSRWDWLLGALLLKSIGLTLHEFRIWVSLLPWVRAPILKVIALGYVSGLLNGVLPVRGGDLIGAALIRRECQVPGAAALAAVGITALLEALVFGVFLLALLLLEWEQWTQWLGREHAQRTLETAGGGLSLLVLACCVAVALAQRASAPADGERPEVGPLDWLRQVVLETGHGLSSWGPLILNLALAGVHVAVVVASFWMLMPSLQLELESPLLTVCALIALSSISAVALPPGLGAGQAAVAVFVFSWLGIEAERALAWAGLSWLINTGPHLALGIVPLWNRLALLPELRNAWRNSQA